MEEKKVFDYTKAQWMTLIVCYCIYFVFGGIESSQGVYYSVMKKELAIPYNVQGFLVSMTSWSFILTSPIIGYGMSFTDVKPIVIAVLLAICVRTPPCSPCDSSGAFSSRSLSRAWAACFSTWVSTRSRPSSSPVIVE